LFLLLSGIQALKDCPILKKGILSLIFILLLLCWTSHKDETQALSIKMTCKNPHKREKNSYNFLNQKFILNLWIVTLRSECYYQQKNVMNS
jgi:hypothetical protein